MKKQLKDIPKFKNEAEEREFWLIHDSKDYIDWSNAIPVYFPNLKPSSSPISIRFPDTILWRLKERANQMDIPYQSLIKHYVVKQLEQESKKR